MWRVHTHPHTLTGMCKSVLHILAVWLLSLCLNVVTIKALSEPTTNLDLCIYLLHLACYNSSLSIHFCVPEYSDN